MDRSTRWTVVVTATVLLVAGCRQAPAEWVPVLEETATPYLDTELARALDQVRSAREQLRSEPERAEELLAVVEEGLAGLRDVYLPLIESRNRAYNAYRFHYLGRDGDAVEQLERIREILLRLGPEADAPLLAELEKLDELVADARIAVESDSDHAATALGALANMLEDFIAKGDLIL